MGDNIITSSIICFTLCMYMFDLSHSGCNFFIMTNTRWQSERKTFTNWPTFITRFKHYYQGQVGSSQSDVDLSDLTLWHQNIFFSSGLEQSCVSGYQIRKNSLFEKDSNNYFQLQAYLTIKKQPQQLSFQTWSKHYRLFHWCEHTLFCSYSLPSIIFLSSPGRESTWTS